MMPREGSSGYDVKQECREGYTSGKLMSLSAKGVGEDGEGWGYPLSVLNTRSYHTLYLYINSEKREFV